MAKNWSAYQMKDKNENMLIMWKAREKKSYDMKLQFTNESTIIQHMHNKKPEISSLKSQPIVQC
jgi:phage terminase large subunit GpA-like protein